MNYIKVEDTYFATYYDNHVNDKWHIRWEVEAVEVLNLTTRGKGKWGGIVTPNKPAIAIFENGDAIKISVKNRVPVIEKGTKEMWGV